MDLDGLTEIQSRYGKAMLEMTIARKAPELKESGGFPRQTIKQGVAQINVTPGTMDGGPIADGSDYDFATQNDIETLFAHRKIWVGITKIKIGEASACESVQDGIHLLNQRKDEQIGSLVMQLAQSIYSSTIGVPSVTSAAISAGAVTVTFADVTRFKEGMRYAWSDNGTVNANLFRAVTVTPGSDGVSGTVAFTCDTSLNGSTIAATDDSFLVHDSTSSRNLTSLESLAGTGNVYTQSGAVTGWTGTTLDHASATYSAEAVLKLLTRMRTRDVNPDLLLVSPKIEERHRALYGSSTYRRFEGDASGKLDPYGNKPFEINGVTALVSPNVPADKIFAIDSSLVKLGVFKNWESLMGDKPRVSEVGYNYLIAQHGHFEIVCRQRKAVGMLKNIAFS